jgi:type 1 fimbriae regulatory protein FimB/type 1 fimbriae regulatory protein FimE
MGELSPDCLNGNCRAIAKMLKRAGAIVQLPLPVHPHMLRHSCGYYLAEQQLLTRDIQEYLEHKSIQHTVRHTAVNLAKFSQIQWA